MPEEKETFIVIDNLVAFYLSSETDKCVTFIIIIIFYNLSPSHLKCHAYLVTFIVSNCLFIDADNSIAISFIMYLKASSLSHFYFIFYVLTANTIEKFPGSEQMTCNILWSHPSVDGHLGGSTFTLYSLILGFAVPLSLILVFYYLVIKKLQTVGPKNKSKDKKRSHRKVTRLVLTVIAVYILCWTPYWVSECNRIICGYCIILRVRLILDSCDSFIRHFW